LITTLASIGLPTLNNFVGEFLVLQGAAIANFQWAVFAAVGVILSACYMLWLYQRTFFGRAPGMSEAAGHHVHHGDVAETAVDDHTRWHMPDLNAREWAAILPLVVLMVWLGIAAQTFLPSISASNEKTLVMTKGGMEQQVKTYPGAKVVADGR
jgi:NADH-quinone oxidoreductase subunit M